MTIDWSIIKKSLNGGELTSAERDMLDKWLQNSSVHRDLYGDAETFYKSSSVCRIEKSPEEIDLSWKEFISRRKARKSIFIKITSVAAMAAAVAAIAMIVFIPGKEIKQKQAHNVIAPGTTKAELLLANGEKIILGENGVTGQIDIEGASLVSDTVSGRLQYNVKEIGLQKPIAFNTLVVPKGGEFQLELSDGTIIWINSESSLRFPERFSTTSRDVFLDGEAFFKVAKNKDSPFRVHYGDQTIEVLGTAFNVSAYKNDSYWRTTLVEGVVVAGSEANRIKMKPSQQYALNRITGEERVKQVNSQAYVSWINGKYYFTDLSFEEIVTKLERWYDFKMIYANEKIKSRRFTGFVSKHEPIGSMLERLQATTDINFTINGNEITVRSK